MKRVALYVRVSTTDQSDDRQLRDLTAAVAQRGCEIITTIREVRSGTKKSAKRQQIIDMAKQGQIDAVMVTELTRWGRSTIDLLDSINELAQCNVSLICLNGFDVDVSTPTGKLMLTLLSAISQFERDLIAERTRSGLRAARARGKRLGRPIGIRPSDEYKDDVLLRRRSNQTIRMIAEDLDISTNTVLSIIKRSKKQK